jgi:cAMP phosphodiesterase
MLSSLTFVCAILFAIAQFILTPAINKASDSKDKKRFGILHGLSVVLNVLQLGIFIYILWPSAS